MESPASSLPQPKTPQELEAVLAQMNTPKTEEVKRATAILKEFLQNPQSLQALMQQITGSSREEVRQMAAVLLRYKIFVHFKKLAPEAQETLKKTLLQRMVAESSRAVKRSLSALVASLAKKIVPKKQWNELLNFLLQLSKSAQVDQRYVGILSFRALAEEIGVHLRPHYKQLIGIFMQGITDPVEAVQLEAFHALNALVGFLETEEDAANFRGAIPNLLGAIQKNVVAKREDHVAVGFEILDNISERPIDVLMPNLPILSQFLVSASANEELEINFRLKAGNLLGAMIQHKPGSFVKHKLVDTLIKLGTKLLIENCPDAFESMEHANSIGIDLMDKIALYIPHRSAFEPIASVAVSLIKTDDEHKQKAGFLILATIADGFGGLLKPQLENLLNAICTNVRNPKPNVRAAAIHALNNFTNYLQPDVVSYHKVVIPTLIHVISNAQETVQVKKKAVQALEDYLEMMGETLTPEETEPYIKPVLEKCVTIITTAKDLGLITLTLCALKSLAGAAEAKFLPFLVPTLKMLERLMKETKDETLDIRAAATDCVGEVAAAVGKEHFQPYLQNFLKLAMSGLDLDYFSIREKTYCFFASLAALLGPEFSKLLETVMPYLIASCESDDGLALTVASHVLDEGRMGGMEEDEEKPAEKPKSKKAEAAAEGTDSEGDDDEEVMRRMKYSIRSGALDEKVSAVNCIETIAINVGEAALPALLTDTTRKALEELSEYLHEQVRAAVLRAYGAILRLIWTVFPNPKPNQLHKKCGAYVQEIVEIMVQRLSEEDDKETAAVACEHLNTAIQNFGPIAFEKCNEPFFGVLETLISEKGPAHHAEEEGVILDHDEVLMPHVLELIGSVAKAMGPKFEPFLKKIMPSILKLLSPERPAGDKEMMIGGLADIGEKIGVAIVPYLPTLVPILLKALDTNIPLLLRNSSYCIGVLCVSGGQAAVKYYQDVLKALAKVIANHQQAAKEGKLEVKDAKSQQAELVSHLHAAKDNATSSVGRLITIGAAHLPMPKTVELFVSGLPIVEDLAEAKNAYTVLVQLAQKTPQLLAPHREKVVAVAKQAQSLADEHVPKPLKEQLATIAKA